MFNKRLKRDIAVLQEELKSLQQAQEVLAEETISLTVDRDMNITSAGPKFLEFLGNPPSSILGQSLGRYTPSYVRDLPCYKNFVTAMNRGTTTSDDYRFVRVDGSMVWARAVWAPVKDASGQVTHMTCYGFDVTEAVDKSRENDALIQALGGLMSITGEPDGAPGAGPQKVGVAVTDLFTGLYSTIGILGALHHREKTGEGQHIDMALLDCQMAMLANVGSSYLVTGEPAARYGNAHATVVPYQAMEASDGHFVIAIGNDRQFARLCRDVLGRPDCGRIEVGARGDVAIWDVSGVESAGSWDPAALLLTGPTRVRDLFVEGRQVVRDGVVTTIDLPKVVEQANRMARALAG